MKKLLLLVMVVALLGCMFSGCATDEPVASGGDKDETVSGGGDKDETVASSDEEIMIAFCYQDLETEFWVAGHKAITETLESLGVKVLERNANEDANKQLEQVKDAIAQGVDGVIIIPQDGASALTIIDECNAANVPIAVFNRPPADDSNDAIVVVADNKVIAEQAVDYMVSQAKEKFEKTNEKITPLIMVGDLGDPNAVGRKDGFYAAVEKEPDIFNEVIEVPTKWDGATGLANLQSALQANDQVDFIFTSSDFLYPQIRSVLEPLGKWQVIGDENHVILGGLDGDSTAGQLMDEGYVDATGVQDLYYEAITALTAIMDAINEGESAPKNWIQDPGFALTQGNIGERKLDMWGNKLRLE